jgi:glucosamine--fructose-6-phosphate aminotransferase (isomerizing)
MEAEIALQMQELPRIDLHESDAHCLFVGAGDSYSSCLAAQYASSNRALSCYPLDLVNDPMLARDRTVYVLSISGKTKANTSAARVARSNGSRTVAITADPDSPLAKSCDQVIQLKYAHTGVSTAGTISFSVSLCTCLSIAGDFRLPENIPSLLESAELQANRCLAQMRAEPGSCYLLGDSALYPVVMYGAMKLNEVVGARAVAYPTEAFCHSPLFALGGNDSVLILGRGDAQDRPLTRMLEGTSVNAVFVEIPEKETAASLFHATFFLQKLALKIAQRKGLRDCHYLQNRSLLKISSDLIY